MYSHLQKMPRTVSTVFSAPIETPDTLSMLWQTPCISGSRCSHRYRVVNYIFLGKRQLTTVHLCRNMKFGTFICRPI